MRLKAQAEIISAILIFTISFSLASAAYLWGVPLINKKQDTAVVERVLGYFDQSNANSLPNLIEDVANRGKDKSFTIETKGGWVLDEAGDSLQFTFTSKVSNIALDTANPISLTKSVSCTPSPSPSTGLLADSTSVVCVKAKTIAANIIEITYKIYFRELLDDPFVPNPKGRKIDLIKDPDGTTSSNEETIKISFGSSDEVTVGGKTLITKKVKILLI